VLISSLCQPVGTCMQPAEGSLFVAMSSRGSLEGYFALVRERAVKAEKIIDSNNGWSRMASSRFRETGGIHVKLDALVLARLLSFRPRLGG
jgi:hypothetical protein